MGPGIKSIMDFFTCRWRASNDENFLKATCYKIMACDPEDDIIDYYSALMSGVAVRLAEKKLETRESRTDLESGKGAPIQTPWD